MPDVLGEPDTLMAELRRRARQTALTAAEAAKKQAAEVLRQADVRCEAIASEFERRTQKEVEAVRGRILAAGELQARERVLNSREELLTRVWNEAENHLRAVVSSPHYGRVLETLALLAARELGETSLMLASDPAGHRLLSPDRLENWSRMAGVAFQRAARPADTWGGLLAWNGRLRYDATFPTSLSMARQLLREETFRTLVGNGD
jgi:vacuolar-type H+-ATPase subunit E/Vma4